MNPRMLVVGISLALAGAANATTVPYTFQAGQAALAGEVNANFTVLEQGVNANAEQVAAVAQDIDTVTQDVAAVTQNIESVTQEIESLAALLEELPVGSSPKPGYTDELQQADIDCSENPDALVEFYEELTPAWYAEATITAGDCNWLEGGFYDRKLGHFGVRGEAGSGLNVPADNRIAAPAGSALVLDNLQLHGIGDLAIEASSGGIVVIGENGLVVNQGDVVVSSQGHLIQVGNLELVSGSVVMKPQASWNNHHDARLVASSIVLNGAHMVAGDVTAGYIGLERGARFEAEHVSSDRLTADRQVTIRVGEFANLAEVVLDGLSIMRGPWLQSESIQIEDNSVMNVDSIAMTPRSEDDWSIQVERGSLLHGYVEAEGSAYLPNIGVRMGKVLLDRPSRIGRLELLDSSEAVLTDTVVSDMLYMNNGSKATVTESSAINEIDLKAGSQLHSYDSEVWGGVVQSFAQFASEEDRLSGEIIIEHGARVLIHAKSENQSNLHDIFRCTASEDGSCSAQELLNAD